MAIRKNNTFLLAIIAVFTVGVAAFVGYTAGSFNANNSDPFSSVKPRNSFANQVKELKLLYDTKISEKTANYNELQAEKEKVSQLMIELENSKADVSKLLKYKTQYQNLENKMRFLVKEILVLKKQKQSISSLKDINSNSIVDKEDDDLSDENIVNERKAINDKPVKSILDLNSKVPANKTLVESYQTLTTNENKNLVSVVEVNVPMLDMTEEKSPELKIKDIDAVGSVSSNDGKDLKTNFARNVDFVKTSFVIEANSIVRKCEKKYCFQIIDPNNNILGKKVTETFDGKTITYSFSKKYKFDGREIVVSENLYENRFNKGDYKVNVYDNGNLVAKTTFVLK